MGSFRKWLGVPEQEKELQLGKIYFYLLIAGGKIIVGSFCYREETKKFAEDLQKINNVFSEEKHARKMIKGFIS